ncbi:hypothetical protein H634G_05815 [Metarhizium anisopliae BRIP 53293]|uniref:Uncharacterized protein n=1 Tax=Metarhizium anisopliae BRIP 53293 TaxID=1291518 RepID=A0A0D9P2F0_METAN|nr:hypothetical protein H634G_05815 [Metarhizium anisopliae BRIP 53293]KJK88793.1 hypothetical protein H633G_07340 [Metarhizium anisopliae BRIP 53284]
MKNFTSDVVKKENVTIRPHVVEGLLSAERPLNNTTLADLAFHNFDLSLSKTKLSTFSAADIDSTSRRSNILPESDALSPMERANQQNADDCSKVNPKDFPNAPEQFPGMSNIGEVPKGKKEVHMESATSLIGTVPLTLDNQITQDSDDFVWQKNQLRPIIRATNDRQHKFYHSPSMNAPEQLELRHVSLQHVADQDNHGILRPSIFDDAYIPQWHTSEVGRHTLRQPYKDDTAHGMSPCDGFIADEPVSCQFQLPPRDPTSDVTVHQNSGVRSPILYQPQVTRGSVDLDHRSSRHLAFQDSQWGGGNDFAPLFRTISVSPMSWAESVFPSIGPTRGQICCNPDSRTKTQFLMGQTPEFHGFGSSETVLDRGMLPHDSDGECSHTFGLKRRRVPNEMGLLQNDESTCSWNPNNDLHDKRARYFDQDLHTVRRTEDLRFLDSIQDRKLNKHPDVESGRDFDILQQAKFGPSRQTIDAPGLVPIHESLYGSTFKLF